MRRTFRFKNGEKDYYDSDNDGKCKCKEDFLKRDVPPKMRLKTGWYTIGYCLGCGKKYRYQGEWIALR